MNALTNNKNSNKTHKRLLCYDQQDAHELLQLLAQSLSNESDPPASLAFSLFNTDLAFKLTCTPPLSNNKNLLSVFHAGHALPGFKLPAQLKNPLVGLMAYKVSCLTCGYCVKK